MRNKFLTTTLLVLIAVASSYSQTSQDFQAPSNHSNPSNPSNPSNHSNLSNPRLDTYTPQQAVESLCAGIPITYNGVSSSYIDSDGITEVQTSQVFKITNSEVEFPAFDIFTTGIWTCYDGGGSGGVQYAIFRSEKVCVIMNKYVVTIHMKGGSYELIVN